MPEDFQERQQSAQWSSDAGNASGQSRGAGSVPGASGAGSWSTGPSGSPIPGMSAKDFQKMCRSVDRAFSQFARIDDENTTLMVTENAYHQYRQFQQSQRQTLAEREAAEAARAAEAAARAAHEQDLSERLTPEQRAFVACGRDYLRQLRSLDERINDAAVSERIVAIEEVVGRILARAEEEPAVIAGLDRLTAYYLPTTVKLLDAYDRLEEEPIQGDNIASSRREIEHTLEVLHGAFEKLFDDTYQDLSLDVSADISVLHAMLAQEGLTEGPFDVKP